MITYPNPNLVVGGDLPQVDLVEHAARTEAIQKELAAVDQYMHRDVEDYLRLLLLRRKIMPAELPARIRENLVARERLRAELTALERQLQEQGGKWGTSY
ncbi:MAG: hypothetical protein EHM39_00935 [Chloroflexi bacterium]|nr:MAG: hypothetical protein EHM39_00935 [Chloroflexota bacterium]